MKRFFASIGKNNQFLRKESWRFFLQVQPPFNNPLFIGFYERVNRKDFRTRTSCSDPVNVQALSTLIATFYLKIGIGIVLIKDSHFYRLCRKNQFWLTDLFLAANQRQQCKHCHQSFNWQQYRRLTVLLFRNIHRKLHLLSGQEVSDTTAHPDRQDSDEMM